MWNQHPEPTGSRWATPTSLEIQQNPGHPPLKADSRDSKIAFWTAVDFAKARDGLRKQYSQYWDLDRDRAGVIDAYVPIHEDPMIGIDGACPDVPPYGEYFSDGLHLTGKAGYPAVRSGYPYFANRMQRYLASAAF
uniref:BpiB04 n=1 Tax=uncultured bacterium Bio7 TaxID=460940 RepID=B2BKB8_9BACT|nr:BpiB04 [uncultured bacterium Bio7]